MFYLSKIKMIGAKKRFEILKRDWFKCQYCGKTWKDVTLEVDHIIPKSRWWTDNIDNLITCCRECNMWKWNRSLDKTEIWKDKVEDAETKLRKDFIDIWNRTWLWTINKDTYILLCKCISLWFKPLDDCYENYKKYFWKYPKTEEKMNEEFYKWWAFCTLQLNYVWKKRLKSLEKKFIEEICDNNRWSGWDILDEGAWDIRLNYLLSRTLIQVKWITENFESVNISKEIWLYYFVMKYTYRKDRMEDWYNWQL